MRRMRALIAVSVLLVACGAAQQSADGAGRCEPFAVEERRVVSDRSGAELFTDERGFPHVFAGLLHHDGRTFTTEYRHIFRAGDRWHEERDIFSGLDPEGPAHFARSRGRFFAAVPTADGTTVFAGSPWRVIARARGLHVDGAGTNGSGELRFVSLSSDDAAHSFDRGEVWTLDGGALRSISSFPFRVPWNGALARLTVDGPSLRYVRERELDVTVHDLEGEPRIETSELLPRIERDEHRTLLHLASGETVELPGTRDGGPGDCPPSPTRLVPRCTPSPMTIFFEGVSAVVPRGEETLVLGSAWRDESDSFYREPVCGNDTRPHRVERRTGSSGRGQLIVAAVRPGLEPQITMLPIATTFDSEVTAVAGAHGRLHALVRRKRISDHQTFWELEYVRIRSARCEAGASELRD
jgi:hypothetical protein